MKILWLVSSTAKHFASGDHPEQGILISPYASARLRVGVAAVEWRRAGNENIFLDPEDADAVRRTDFEAAKICMVPKFFIDSQFDPWFEACLFAKRSGARLVLDICDHPFYLRPPSVTRFYEELLKVCDVVTVNSTKMAELIAPHSRREPLVIDDAILGTARKPDFAPGGTLRLLWFGHSRNLPFLQKSLDSLLSLGLQRRCKLTVVTDEGSGAEELTQEIQGRFAPAFKAQFIPWSLEAMAAALRACDLVLLPSDPSNPIKVGASANRIAEALNAGRFPIASPLPSYLPFAESAWLGDDMGAGIKWALGNRGEVLVRIRRGQALVAERFALEKLGREWRQLFESLA